MISSPKINFNNQLIAISASANEDLPRLGFLENDVKRVLSSLATTLVQHGARIAYGGDLRPGGFTQILFQEIAEAYATAQIKRGNPPFIHFVPEMVWQKWTTDELFEHVTSMADSGLTYLFSQEKKYSLRSYGSEIYLTSPNAGESIITQPDQLNGLFDESRRNNLESAKSLTIMRKAMAQEVNAQILLGGQIQNYKGSMPGIGEEAISMLELNKPIIPLGGFGGMTYDICRSLSLTEQILIEQDKTISEDFKSGYIKCLNILSVHYAKPFLIQAKTMGTLPLLRHIAMLEFPKEIASTCIKILSAFFSNPYPKQ